MPRPKTWIIDITHLLDARGEVPPELPPVSRYMGSIVAAASVLSIDELHILQLGCRCRPGHRACPGQVCARIDSGSGAISWECTSCEAGGLISNWHGSPWDKRPGELSGFTPPARRAWLRVPPEIRLRILNNVYCVRCHGSASMAVDSASVSRSDLVLRGRCTGCGGPVARVVEEVGGA